MNERKSCSDGSLCLWGWYCTVLLSEQCLYVALLLCQTHAVCTRLAWWQLLFIFFILPCSNSKLVCFSVTTLCFWVCYKWKLQKICLSSMIQTNRRETMISLMLNCICSFVALYLLIFCMCMSKGFGLCVSKQSPASGLAYINGINLLPKWLLWLTL